MTLTNSLQLKKKENKVVALGKFTALEIA